MRASVRMTRYLESWGAAKPFANLHHRDSMSTDNGKINTTVSITPRTRSCMRKSGRQAVAEGCDAVSRMFPWASITSRGGRGERRPSRCTFRLLALTHAHVSWSCPPLRSKSQRRRFEEELNERMIRTIDGINSQK